MDTRTWHVVCVLAALVAGMTVCADESASGSNPAREPKKKYDKGGGYVRAFYVNNEIGGDFDDTMVLTAPGAAVDIPKVNEGNGFGIALGARESGKYFGGGGEISYSRSSHDTESVLLGSNDATFNAVDLTFLVDVKTIFGLRPYGFFGVGLNWMTIANSYTEDGYTFDDADFWGYSFFYGGGVQYFIIPSCCINAGVGYRMTSFGSVEGHDIEDGLSARGTTYNLGFSYVF